MMETSMLLAEVRIHDHWLPRPPPHYNNKMAVLDGKIFFIVAAFGLASSEFGSNVQ